MTENNNNYDYDTTPEIKQGHADVGKFNIAIQIILTTVCIIYLILHFNT